MPRAAQALAGKVRSARFACGACCITTTSPPRPTSAPPTSTEARRCGRHQPARARRQDPPDPRPLQVCPGKIPALSFRKFVSEISRKRHLLTLSPAGRGRGQGEGADEPVRRTAHLSLPLRGPLPLPLKGGEGLLQPDDHRPRRDLLTLGGSAEVHMQYRGVIILLVVRF
jgi:hypothetical protein